MIEPQVDSVFYHVHITCIHQYFSVLSVRVCVCPCVADVTSTNESQLRENTREGRGVITQYTRTSTAACVEIMRCSDNLRDYYDGLK